MKNKGQALVEFILILPIFIIIIITMVDFSNILLNKYSLERDLDVIADMYKQPAPDDINKYLTNNDIQIEYERNDEFITIKLSKNINVISPILISIMGNTYEINTSGVYYE